MLGGPAGADDAEVAVLVINIKEIILVLLEVGSAAPSKLMRQIKVQSRMVLEILILQVVVIELPVLAQ